MRFAGVTFFDNTCDIRNSAGKHTYEDWNLALTSPAIPKSPEPNIYTVDIPGGNGYINYTDALVGEPTYKSRKDKFSFLYLGKRSDVASVYSEIQSAVHGKELRVVVDEDPDYYYKGIFEVSALSGNKGKIKLNIEYTLLPFKFSIDETSLSTEYNSESSEQYSKVSSFTTLQSINPSYSMIRSYGCDYVDLKTDTLNLQIRLPMSTYGDADESVSVIFTDTDYKTYTIKSLRETLFKAAAAKKNYDYAEFDLTNTSASPLSSDINWEKVLFIRVLGWGSAEVWAEYAGTTLEIPGCDRTIIPRIKCPASGMICICNGERYTIGTDTAATVDGLKIPRDGTTLVFGSGSASVTSGTITVSYRGQWL